MRYLEHSDTQRAGHYSGGEQKLSPGAVMTIIATLEGFGQSCCSTLWLSRTLAQRSSFNAVASGGHRLLLPGAQIDFNSILVRLCGRGLNCSA
jgi:hypothetical protein